MPSPPPTNRDAALHVLRGLRDAGFVAYFAGGCVRDQLLGLTPKDHDVATSAAPADVRRVFRNTQAVGAAFGVILVRIFGYQIEVATFRTDGSYTDGRRPDQVRFATPEEDALRRDFTINGLFLDPLDADASPSIIDFVSGQADLAARVLRAIGDADRRFAEDHLRLLRAVRFAARFDLTIDPPTAAAIKRNAPHLRRIAPERVGDELRRIFSSPVPEPRTRAWNLLRSLQLTPELFRYLDCTDLPTLSVLPHLAPPPATPPDQLFPLTLSAAILEETAPPPATEPEILSVLSSPAIASAEVALRQSLRLSNEESALLTSILTWTHTLLSPPHTPPLAIERRFLASPAAACTLTLLNALQSAGCFLPQLAKLLPHLASLTAQDNAPPPLLTGDHLTAAGLRPGPLFRKLLEATYDAQLEGHLTTPAQALSHALSLAPGPKSPP